LEAFFNALWQHANLLQTQGLGPMAAVTALIKQAL